jgi:hypothetical protein
MDSTSPPKTASRLRSKSPNDRTVIRPTSPGKAPVVMLPHSRAGLASQSVSSSTPAPVRRQADLFFDRNRHPPDHLSDQVLKRLQLPTIPVADILTIASCDGLVQQTNSIITREVEATHRHRRRIIVTRDDCIAIETDAILVLVHRSSTSFPAASFTAKATTRHKRAPRRLWRRSSQRWLLFQHRGASYFLLDLT